MFPTRELSYVIVDSFATPPNAFTGNAGAVVFDADGLTDDEMRGVASEFNLSETTFVLAPGTPDADVRFRWFTPSAEVSMCGHATLAAVHALAETDRFANLRGKLGEKPPPELRIQTTGGPLTAGVRTIVEDSPAQAAWVQLVPPTLTVRELNTDKLAELLRTTPQVWEHAGPTVVTQDDDLIVMVRDFQALNELSPDFAQLAHWCMLQRLRGVLVSTTRTLSRTVHAQSRFFAPAAGVDEDPVTGSAHGPLGAYLVTHKLVPSDKDGCAALECLQAKAGGRSGLVRVLIQPRSDGRYDACIGGVCFTTMRGTLLLP